MSEKIIGITVGTQLPKPDFAQTDPTKGDYIKNKPDFEGLNAKVDTIGDALVNHEHSWNDLTDRPFYSKVTEVLPETTVAIDQSNLSVEMKTRLDIVDGGTYTVNWNGTEYVCVAKDVEQFGVVSTLLGNYAYNMGTGDTGEPFMIAVYDEETAAQYGGYATCIYVFDGSASVTLSVMGEIVKKLDKKYLPEHLQFGETVVGGDTLTWDGNTEGRATFAVNTNIVFYKVSDAVPKFDELPASVNIKYHDTYGDSSWDGMSVTQRYAGVVGNASGWVWFVYQEGVGHTFANGDTIPEPGTYFMVNPIEDQYTIVTSLTIPGYTGFQTKTVKPIDEKYMPETVLRASDIPTIEDIDEICGATI